MASITAKQIAQRLGISPSAVSLALNGKPGVSEATRSRVLAIASQMGYAKAVLPGDAGSDLTICFVRYANQIVNIAENSSFSSFVLQGVEARASQLGYNTQVRYMTPADLSSAQIVEHIRRAAGIVFLGTDITQNQLPRIEQFLESLGEMPVVVVDSLLLSERVDCVCNDCFGGARAAVMYLLEQGHRSVGYVRANPRIENFYQREQGILSAVASYGLELAAVVDVDVSSEGAVRDFENWLSQGKALPQAFFAENDVLAAAAIRALKKHGYRVPEDVSVMGFDDIPICEMIDPPLSTVRTYKEQLGTVAMDHLHQRIQRHEIPQRMENLGRLKTTLSTTLCIRGSTGKGVQAP